METAYTYDGDGNVRTLETKAGEDVLLSFAYRYDGNGNRTAKAGVTLGGITSEITAGNNALDISYAYDVRGQWSFISQVEANNGATLKGISLDTLFSMSDALGVPPSKFLEED